MQLYFFKRSISGIKKTTFAISHQVTLPTNKLKAKNSLHFLISIKKIVPTIVVQFIFKRSQYRKCTQTNISIHFINKKLPIPTFPQCFYMKICLSQIRLGINRTVIILHNNSTKHCFLGFDEEK